MGGAGRHRSESLGSGKMAFSAPRSSLEVSLTPQGAQDLVRSVRGVGDKGCREEKKVQSKGFIFTFPREGKNCVWNVHGHRTGASTSTSPEGSGL